MRAFKWTADAEVKVKRNGEGKLGCCCSSVLHAVLADYQPAACAYYPPVAGYVTYSAVLVDGAYEATQTTSTTWEFGVADGVAIGSIYYNAECTGDVDGISGFSAIFYISEAAGVYTVTALAAPGGDSIFSGSGAINTPIANTAGSGTITLSF